MENPPKNVTVLTTFANRVWQVEGGISKRPGAVYVCEALGPLLDRLKMPKHLNRASIKKWSARSNGKRHLTLVTKTRIW